MLDKKYHTVLWVIGLVIVILVTGLWKPMPANLRWLLIMVIVVLFLLTISKQAAQRYDSFLIDQRNKISLSRFQMTLWTVLILSALLTIALDRNIPGLFGQPVDGLGPLNISFPEELLLALGISTASLAGSSLIKRTQSESQASLKLELQEDDDNRARNALDAAKAAYGNVSKEVVAQTQKQGELEEQIKAEPADPEKRLLAAQTENTQKLDQARKQLEAADKAVKTAEAELSIQDETKRNKQGTIHRNESLADAEWSDMFRGDEISN